MDLIVGLPHEDFNRFGQSFNDLFSLQPHALQIGFLKLLKGSGVRRMREYKYVADPLAPYEVLSTHVLPYDDVRFLKYFEDVFERFYNSERFRTTFGYIGQQLIHGETDAFTYFCDMTHAWLKEGNHKVNLKDIDQIEFLYRFFLAKGDTIAAEFYKETYGEKVYKLPVALPLTCPNRDGSAGVGGCTFCGEIGAGYENRPAWMTVRMQLEENIAHIGPKYKAKKFIPYYQNFSNTYLPLEDFKSYMEQGCIDEAVGIAIATRPDCISNEYLDVLQDIQQRFHKDIYIELGLQTVNYHTLEKINRGHDLAQFIDAVLRIKRYGFNVTTHMIVNLPWDTMEDTIEGAKILSSLGVDQVKLHALYIVKHTLMAKWYEEGQITLISAEEYAERVVQFLRHLHPDIVLQRLVGRAPEDNTLFTNWSMGWWRVQDLIDDMMDELDAHQGDLCDYLNGKAVRKFIDGGQA